MPVGNEEGEIISAALGDKRAILLSHHGMLVAAASVEKPACWRCSSSAPRACSCWRWRPARSSRSRRRWGAGARLDPDAAPLAGGFRLRAAGAQDASRRVGLRLAALQGGGACVSPPGSASGRRRPLVRSGRGARRTGAFRACLPVVFRSTPAHDRPASPIADPAPPASPVPGAAGATHGPDQSYLSKLERGLSEPSISTVLRLAEAYGVGVSQLVGSDQNAQDELVSLVRVADREALQRGGLGAEYRYESLAGRRKVKAMEPFVVHPPREFPDATAVFPHPGEEFLLVLRAPSRSRWASASSGSTPAIRCTSIPNCHTACVPCGTDAGRGAGGGCPLRSRDSTVYSWCPRRHCAPPATPSGDPL